MKCLCGYEGDDFTWLPLMEVCIPDNIMATEEMLEAWEKTEEIEKRIGMPLPRGELKRAYACPKCGTMKVEIAK
jgi:acetone carboxylase gamma subunit